ncbi:MAG TPA: hypothetical protein VGF45_04755 [Polyangia bacterium]
MADCTSCHFVDIPERSIIENDESTSSIKSSGTATAWCASSAQVIVGVAVAASGGKAAASGSATTSGGRLPLSPAPPPERPPRPADCPGAPPFPVPPATIADWQLARTPQTPRSLNTPRKDRADERRAENMIYPHVHDEAMPPLPGGAGTQTPDHLVKG